MPFKVTCKKDPTHNRFSVTAHVSELWEVDENGDYVEVITTLDTVHRPNSTDQFMCIECDSEAIAEEIYETPETVR